MQEYYNVVCNVILRQSQQYNVGNCLYFTGIDKILVEDIFIQVHDVMTKDKVGRNIHFLDNRLLTLFASILNYLQIVKAKYKLQLFKTCFHCLHTEATLSGL